MIAEYLLGLLELCVFGCLIFFFWKDSKVLAVFFFVLAVIMLLWMLKI